MTRLLVIDKFLYCNLILLQPRKHKKDKENAIEKYRIQFDTKIQENQNNEFMQQNELNLLRITAQ